MGVGRSRVSPICYDDACKRVSPKILERIEETFKRSSSSGYLAQATFIRDVLGDSVPGKLSEAIYHAFGGTQKGLTFKDLLSGLVLIVRGTKQEKAKFIGQMVSEDGEYVKRETLESLISVCDIFPSPVDLSMLFRNDEYRTIEAFQRWIISYPDMASFSKWLLTEESSVLELEGEPDSLTFYQTLAQTYKVSEKEVMDIEKTYWVLKSSGKFDLDIFQKHVSPPIPQELAQTLFRVMDVNNDGHLDLAEVLEAVAVWCGSDSQEVHKYCFSVFDVDRDGQLSREELTLAITQMQTIKEDNAPPSGVSSTTMPLNIPLDNGKVVAGSAPEASYGTGSVDTGREDTASSADDLILETSQERKEEVTAEDIAATALEEYGKANEGFLSVDEYLSWTSTHPELAQQLPNLLFELSHIRLGVKPKNREDEARVVSGYLLRFAKSKREPGDLVYLISAGWFQKWAEYTGYQRSYPTLVTPQPKTRFKKHKKKRKSKQSVELSAPPMAPSLAPPSSTMIEEGEEVVEILEMPNYIRDNSPRGSAVSDVSEISVISKDESLKPPTIDNTPLCVPDPPGTKKLPSITNEGGKLLTNKLLMEGNDFVLLPEVIWKVFVQWYCPGYYNIPALPRTIGEDGQVELYPMFFRLFRHTTMPPPLKPSSLPWPIASIMHTLGLGNSPPTPSPPLIATASGGDGEMTPTQAPIPRRIPYYTAAFVKNTTLAEASEKIQQTLRVDSDDLRLYDLSDENSPVLLEDDSVTIQDLASTSDGTLKIPKDGYRLLIETRNKDNTWPEEMIALVKEVQEKDKKKNKDKPQKSIQVQPGATGLSNLGNTCFMNSALQCVSNAQPLTQYFQNKDHLLEINKDNPLGMQGVMAKRYGELVHELWNGSAKSITPLKFRFTVGRCAPHFNGFQQQDSQELLAFVLDGLHEDLNRVKVKAYKELLDSDGRPDEEVAQEAWDYHLSRNKSIIVDLFHGQLKSEVTCKECQYKSVRFDPFTFLSLPLPMESTVNLEITVMFLDGRQPVRYGLKLEIDDKYRQLKEELGKLCGIPSGRLLLAEVYSCNFKSWLKDSTKIRNVLGGWLYAYELPDPALIPTTRRSDSPDEISRKRNLNRVKRERTLSIKQVEEERSKAAKVREKLARDGLRGERGVVDDGERGVAENGEMGARKEEEEMEAGKDGSSPKRRRMVVEVLEKDGCQTRDIGSTGSSGGEDDRVNHEQAHISGGGGGGGGGQYEEGGGVLELGVEKEGGISVEKQSGLVESGTGKDKQFEDSDEISNNSLGHCHRSIETFQETYVYTVHRRAYVTDNYFLSNQKNRLMLFSTPLIVPCTYSTFRHELYASVWAQVKRLIIPEPPTSNSGEEEKGGEKFPFVLKQVTNDGMHCSKCPWYRFCRGCVIPCDATYVGDVGKFIAIDWDNITLHLKYLMSQEKPDEHESMESLKIIDTQPIDLYKCFKAFVREDQLGDEESWYCKKCMKHREAIKSLEIWRFPPILIIHLKRFQFVNGRWVKSQRDVSFPLTNLDPLRYTVQNGNGNSSGSNTPRSPSYSETTIREEQLVRKSLGEIPRSSPINKNGEDSGRGTENEVRTLRDSESVEQQPNGQSVGGSEVEEEEEEMEENGKKGVSQVMMELSNLSSNLTDGNGDTTEDSATSVNGTAHPPKLYDLFAISCHTGMLGGGHYTCFAKNINEKWYYFNDSSCKETTPERVEQESPYMLFYQLQNIGEMGDQFRAENRQGKAQDIGTTEDDREFEETLKTIKKTCVIQ